MKILSEKELVQSVRRKIKIENLTRCCNCLNFKNSKCKKALKEELVDCADFIELPSEEQVIVISLIELNNQPELF